MTTPDKYMPNTTMGFIGKCVEECGELQESLGKTLRWGMFSANPELRKEDQELNRDWILREMKDVEEAIQLLRNHINKRFCDKDFCDDFI